MRVSAKRMALCAMMVALCVVLMVLGAILELGMYVAPLLSGLLLIPVGKLYGKKYHIVVFAASALLCFLLVPNMEENLVYAGFLGWYPILRPLLQKLPKWLRWIVKLVVFNVLIVAIEALVMLVLAPEAMEGIFLWILLVLANVVFVTYDIMLPRLEGLVERIVKP